ncbi:hypothetical protein BGX23_001171 [Mortierella sp. AD031]|nr:hypothetical protein BGX23_001171 [Mortierella sp. AD031]
MASPGFFARLKLVNPSQSVAKDSDALRIGILGAANIAPSSLIGPAKHLRSIVVVSVAARDQAKAKTYADKNGIPNTHASYDALINDPTIDCIYNPLPNGLHYEWTRKALEAGKHVLLEKPASSNEAQAKELFQLARSKNLILLEAFHYRFHPASIRFRKLVQEHVATGHDIQKVESIMSFPTIFPADDIRFNYKLGGGIVMDAGCYTINSIRYFSGLEVESVEAATPKIVSEDIDGRMEATLTLKGGAQAKLIASLTNPWFSVQTYREVFPRVTIETDDKIFTFGVFLLPSIYHYITVKDRASGKTEKLPKLYNEGFSTYKYQLDAFVTAVKHVKENPSIESQSSQDIDVVGIAGWVDGEDTIANMKVIDAVYKRAGMNLRVVTSPGFYARTKLANPAQSVSNDQDALRIGILGAANIAPGGLIGPAKHMRSITVVSIAARDHAKAKIGCIYNLLPNGLHYEWTRKALEAGKHVLLEKPAASNASQTQELVTLAQEKNLVLLEALHYRFHPASIKFRGLAQQELARDGGQQPKRVEAIMSFPQVFPKDDIRFKYDLAGGVEDIEEARPKIVREDIDRRMNATLILQGGVRTSLITSLINPWFTLQTYREYLSRVIVETESKVLTFMVFLIPSTYHYITVKTKSTNKSKTLKVYGEGFSTYKYQFEAFVKTVKHVKENPSIESRSSQDIDVVGIPGWVTGQDSVENLRVIDAIYKRAGMRPRV